VGAVSKDPHNVEKGGVMTKKKDPAEKQNSGRPSDYEAIMAEQAGFICKTWGATDQQLAEFFKVTQRTVDNWKKAHPEFFQSSKNGKDDYDSEHVERALKDRATGWTSPDGKYFPPDPASMIFWLKNRRRDRWTDKQEVEHSGGMNISVNVLSKKKPGA
jgi:hypothetical protein